MSEYTVLNGELKLVFNKRSMRSFVMEKRVIDALDIDNVEDDLTLSLMANFATYLARTVDVVDVAAKSNTALSWLQFWKVRQQHNDYKALFEAYFSNCELEVNNEWYDALKQHEESDPLLDTSVSAIQGDSEDAKKNDETTESP